MSDQTETSAAAEASDPWESREVRDQLSTLLRRDLLGPWDGEDEVVGGTVGPRDRYIVGLLAPLDVDADADCAGDADELDSGGFGDESDDKPVAGVSSLRLFPSSMGATFTVAVGVDQLVVSASWGRYQKQSSPRDADPDDEHQPRDQVSAGGSRHEQGVNPAAGEQPLAVNDTEGTTTRTRRPWQRVALSGQVEIDLAGAQVSDDGRFIGEQRVDAAGAPEVWVRWIVRRQGDGRRIVTVFLLNRQTKTSMKSAGVNAAWMFQAGFRVEAPDAAAVFEPSRLADEFIGEAEDREQLGLAMLYRHTPEYAVGHGVSVGWHEPEDVDPAHRRADRVWTEALPFHDVAQTRAPSVQQVPGFADLVLDMRRLAYAEDGAAAAAMLRPLVSAYREWIAAQEASIDTDASLIPYRGVAVEHLRKASVAADRIEVGLDLLAADDQVWQSFQFMNEAMALQRQHTEAMNARRTDAKVAFKQALAAADVPQRRSWRPFQIAFVLLNLPALADPTHPERRAADVDTDGAALADLLFFPTGGGKTEAYLGLTAFTFAIRRLQGHREGLDGSRGVAVLMRYTLRLLTSQQLQRAATLVAATEMIRRKAMAAGVNPWGVEPFRIGLWVGGSVTPNRFDDSVSFVQSERGWSRSAGRSSASPVPFTECPWCGSTISTKTDVEANVALRRTRIYCGDAAGGCEFTQAKNLDGLPVLAVDEEIYRFPPSLLIATVDKFAQLPRNGASGHLFGHVTEECTRHGFKHADIRAEICGAATHRGDRGLPPALTQPAQRLRPPDLIIQDELHLIADALGTMVGLYETAVDELATWTVAGQPVRPKVVASTATVRRAEEQAYGLFRRQLAVFPPPGLDVADSFFARQVPVNDEHPGRRYLGVCAQGLRLKSVEIRVTSAILSFTQALFDDHGAAADPYMTLVGYFNALRELGGMRRLVEDDIAARLRRPLHDTMPARRDPAPFLAELTSRVSSGAIKDTLKAIEVPFDPVSDTTTARQAAMRSRTAKKTAAKKAVASRSTTAADRVVMAKDVVLATSMFGVGVDIPRLGLMTVTGQPKATSEYIQATSRVGRDPSRPGLVVTIYNWARPRDLSHYERFGQYHAAFYQQVEALSVTPFSIPALNRAATGAYLGALRHLHPTFNPDTGLNAVAAGDSEVERLMAVFAERAATVTGRADMHSEVENLLRKRLLELDNRRDGASGQTLLAYRGGKDGTVRVLRDPESGRGWDMWTVPNSLRETEPEINLQVIPYDPTIADPTTRVPGWQPPGTGHGSTGDGHNDA